MKLKTIFSLFFFALFVGIIPSACNQNISKTKINNPKEVEVIYESCAVYASSTKFYFKPSEGESIEVSVLNKGMDDYPSPVKIPKNLVDNDKNLEGPPGANPKMVGKRFKLIYNDKDELMEIKPIN